VCVKCPYGSEQLYDATCYSCPTGHSLLSLSSGMKCVEACADGAMMVVKRVPSTVTSDMLRCSATDVNQGSAGEAASSSAGSTICKEDGDFQANLTPSPWDDWTTCQSYSNDMLRMFWPNRASWTEVTDEEIRSKRVVDPSSNYDDRTGACWSRIGNNVCYDKDETAFDSCDFRAFDTDMNGCMSEGEYYMQVDANDASYPSFGVIDGAWGLDGCVSEDDFYNGCFLTLYFREHDANGDGCWSYSDYYAAGEGQQADFDAIAGGDDCLSHADLFAQAAGMVEGGSGGGSLVSSGDSCIYAFDGVCDEGMFCDEGTDTFDCQHADSVLDTVPAVPVAVPQAPELDEFESFYNQQFTPKQDMCVMFAPGEQFPAQEELLDSHAKCTGQGHAWMSPRYYQEGQWNSEPTCEAGVCSSAPWDWSLAKKKDQCESVGGVCSTSCPVCRHDEWFWYESNEEYCIADAIGSEDACNNKGMTWNAEYSTCFTDVQSPACVGGTRILSCRDLDLGACDASVLADPIYDGTALDETSGEFGLKCYIDYYAPCKNKTVCESGGSCNDEDYTSWEDSPVCRIPFTQGLCA